MTDQNDKDLPAKEDSPVNEPKKSGGLWRWIRNSLIGAAIAYVALTLFVPVTLPKCDSDLAKSEMLRAINEGPYSRRSGVRALRIVEVQETSFDAESEVRTCRAMVSRNDAKNKLYRVELIKVGESGMEVTMELM